MKVRFCCDNGANVHSRKVQVFDTEEDLGLTGEEWIGMNEDEKNKIVEEWAMEQFEWWCEEEEQ